MDVQRAATLSAFVLSLTMSGAAFAADPPPPGAAACSGCHATSRWTGSEVPRLVGRNPSEIVNAMADFRAGKRPATVMDRIAKGFTDDEVRAMAAWYGAQKD